MLFNVVSRESPYTKTKQKMCTIHVITFKTVFAFSILLRLFPKTKN